MIASCTLPPEPQSIPQARRFVVDALPGLRHDDAEIVVLMVSELATNCVLHAGSTFDIVIQHTGRYVRVEVTDAGPGLAAARSPRSNERNGRGLRIVESLAEDWGVIPAPAPPGKTVWFTAEARIELND